MGVCDKKCNVAAVFYQVKQEGKEKMKCSTYCNI